MNEEKYVLAQLKRIFSGKGLIRDNNLYYGYEVLTIIAKLEADAILGEEVVDDGLPFQDEEDDK